MNKAIWAIVYRVADTNRRRYLEWFHEVHIPDKLARPGYTWAAHYTDAAPGACGEPLYVALFGGTETRVFFDPSPAQLKLTQDDLTREMMSCRVDSSAHILGEEWCVNRTDRRAGRIDAPAVRVTARALSCGQDESFGAWCAQEYFPELARSRELLQARKYFASSGPAKHVIIEEFASVGACDEAPRRALKSEWHRELRSSMSCPLPRLPTLVCLWPPRGR